jgi:hypothetical protein
MTLKSLAEKYCCDKLYAHSYIENFYEQALADRHVRHLLEIGIGFADLMTPFVPRYIHGCSLRMWEEYFSDAEIYSCDIRPETLVNEGRIHSIVADQSKAEDLAKLLEFAGGGFDVICDDGSHLPQHQIFTAQFFLPAMTHGGIYIIEDVGSPERVMIELLPDVRRLHGASLTLWQGTKRPDDNLVIIKL